MSLYVGIFSKDLYYQVSNFNQTIIQMKSVVSFTLFDFYPTEDSYAWRFIITFAYLGSLLWIQITIGVVDIVLLLSAVCLNNITNNFEALVQQTNNSKLV